MVKKPIGSKKFINKLNPLPKSVPRLTLEKVGNKNCFIKLKKLKNKAKK